MNEIISTTYADGKIQYWLAAIDEEYFSIRDLIGGSGTMYILPIQKYMDKLKSRWQDKAISFTPLIGNCPDAYCDRGCARGYDNDPAPFIVRNRTLPEFTATIFNHDCIGHLRVVSGRYRQPLTVGQHQWINETFADQLSAFHTQEFVEFLVNQAIQRMQKNIIDKMAELKRSMETFETFLMAQ